MMARKYDFLGSMCASMDSLWVSAVGTPNGLEVTTRMPFQELAFIQGLTPPLGSEFHACLSYFLTPRLTWTRRQSGRFNITIVQTTCLPIR